MAPEATRRLAALLSADVAGYSRFMGEDELGTIQTLTACRSLISNLVGDHHGRVVDSPGDNPLRPLRTAPVQGIGELHFTKRAHWSTLARKETLWRS